MFKIKSIVFAFMLFASLMISSCGEENNTGAAETPGVSKISGTAETGSSADTAQTTMTETSEEKISGTTETAKEKSSVFSDTKSLLICADAEKEIPEDISADDFETVMYEWGDDLDAAEIAENCPSLEKLCINGNIYTANPAEFAKLGALREIDLDLTSIFDVEFISGLKAEKITLRDLDTDTHFSSAAVKELCLVDSDYLSEDLENMPQLEIITLKNSTVHDDGYGFLKLANLKKLDIYDSYFGGAMLRRIRKNLPDCEIIEDTDRAFEKYSDDLVFLYDVSGIKFYIYEDSEYPDDGYNYFFTFKNETGGDIEDPVIEILNTDVFYANGYEEMQIYYPSEMIEVLKYEDRNFDHEKAEAYLPVLFEYPDDVDPESDDFLEKMRVLKNGETAYGYIN